MKLLLAKILYHGFEIGVFIVVFGGVFGVLALLAMLLWKEPKDAFAAVGAMAAVGAVSYGIGCSLTWAESVLQPEQPIDYEI